MTYIIGEICSNWRTTEEAVRSIEIAADCGADAVKFQMFRDRELYGHSVDGFKAQVPDLPLLAECARVNKVHFLCTAFSAAGVWVIDPYVDSHKVASAEMMDPEILTAVGRTNKPVYISTGGHTIDEVRQVLSSGNVAFDKITLFYCESAYPATCTNFGKLKLLRELGQPVGLSDHSREIYMTGNACSYLDIPVIEKHVNLVGAQGPDSPHSLNPEEFKAFCDNIKGTAKVELLSSEEADMITTHNRRLVLTTHVAKGEMLMYGENYGSYRSLVENAHGISPLDWDKVNNRIATRDMHLGETITEGDFE